MYNGFSCYKRKSGGESDEKISVVVSIQERENGIDFRVSRQVQTKYGSSFSEQQSENILIESLADNEVLRIAKLLEKWLKSRSNATVTDMLEGVNGVHKEKRMNKGLRTKPSGPSEITNKFDRLSLSVGKQNVQFGYWNEDENEWHYVEMPAASLIERGVPSDLENIENLYYTLYDFFEFEYSEGGEFISGEEALDLQENNEIEKVEHLMERFGQVVNALKNRRSSKEALVIEREEDAQYLLSALLRLHFDDVRRESYLEEHTGKGPRIDLFLKSEKIGIELKMAHENNSPSQIRDQLLIDISEYQIDENVDTLIIFIFDPGGRFQNPAEFENDLPQETPNMSIRVMYAK